MASSACSCWKWCLGFLVAFGAMVLIVLFCFMRGQRSSPDITGNKNSVKSFETSDISLFHYTDLSERVENYNGIQQNHNIVKYCILAAISGLILLIVIFKCFNLKKHNRRNRRIEEALEMTSIHNNALMKKGIVPRHYKKDEKQKKKQKEQKMRRKYESESEGEEDDKKQKDRRRGGVEEAEDCWKQKQQLKEIEVVEVGEDLKQKPQSGGEAEGEEGAGGRTGDKKKKTRRKWRWVEASSGSE